MKELGFGRQRVELVQIMVILRIGAMSSFGENGFWHKRLQLIRMEDLS